MQDAQLEWYQRYFASTIGLLLIVERDVLVGKGREIRALRTYPNLSVVLPHSTKFSRHSGTRVANNGIKERINGEDVVRTACQWCVWLWETSRELAQKKVEFHKIMQTAVCFHWDWKKSNMNPREQGDSVVNLLIVLNI